jgi:GntR family transcriptional regulator
MTPAPNDRADGVGRVTRWLEDVDPRSATPLYEQIATRLRAAVAGGWVREGDPLPSVRRLAALLRINPATVVQAYRELERDGFAELRQGSGTYVRGLEAESRRRERRAQARRLVRELLDRAARLGVSSRALRDALNERPTTVRARGSRRWRARPASSGPI